MKECMKDVEILSKTEVWKSGEKTNNDTGIEMALACIENIRSCINSENLTQDQL